MEKNELTDSQKDTLRALAISDIKSSAIGSAPHNGADNIKVITISFVFYENALKVYIYHQVLVRVRPFSEKEIADKNDFVVDIISGKSLSVTNLEGKKSFQCSFDAVLGEFFAQWSSVRYLHNLESFY